MLKKSIEGGTESKQGAGQGSRDSWILTNRISVRRMRSISGIGCLVVVVVVVVVVELRSDRSDVG